jgi:hypothetical protein
MRMYCAFVFATCSLVLGGFSEARAVGDLVVGYPTVGYTVYGGSLDQVAPSPIG